MVSQGTPNFFLNLKIKLEKNLKILKCKKRSGGLTLFDSRTCYKAAQIKTGKKCGLIVKTDVKMDGTDLRARK